MSTKGVDIFQIDYNELTIPEKHIGAVLGYPNGDMPGHIRAVYEEVEQRAFRFCTIKGGYRIFNPEVYSLKDSYIEISGKRLNTGRTITKQLKGSKFAVIFACTIGPDLEAWSAKLLSEGEGVKGYIIDAIGSETVELAISKIEATLALKMQYRGFSISNRFSPGYCGWPTNDQHTLFSLLPDNFCGISLTHTALMLPIKSVSGIIGIGSDIKKIDYICNLCEMTDCMRRTINQLS